MITVAAPAFLVAGGLLATAPVVLHLLARRPPRRAALPTARFLAEDSRSLLRFRRTPTDPTLLLLRVFFALALGAAFAGLRWVPGREGSRQVILLDAGADSLVPWAALVDAVEEAAGGAPETDPDGPGQGEPSRAPSLPDEPPLVLAYGLDDGPRAVAATAVGELARGSDPATLEDGLRALRREAAGARFAEAQVTWVGRPSWRIWSPAVGLMRPALWPGSLRFRAVGDAPGVDSLPGEPSPGAPPARPRVAPVARIAAGPAGEAVARAVVALGGRVLEATDEAPGGSPDWIVAETTPGDGPASWLPQLRTGSTLLAFGEPNDGFPDLPWTAPARPGPPPDPALVLLPGDRAVGGAVPRVPGHPATGARTLLTFDDGAPAAAAREVGEGCVVFFAARLTDPMLTASPAYPELLRTLLHGCREPGYGDGPLDRGAREVLERPDLPATVEVAAILEPEGAELTSWLLLAALALLALEVVLTRSGRSPAPGAAGKPGTPS